MKPLLLIYLLFVSAFVSAQTSKSVHDQLVFVNEQWNSQQDADASLKLDAAKSLGEQGLIQLHLQETEKLLRKVQVAGLSARQQQQRLANLNTLHNYWVRGIFPVNDKHQNRQPYFIDKYNTYCAVGYLMQQSGGDAMARNIHETQNYSYLSDISHPKLMSWINQSGLSLDELALIQPTYQNDRPTTILELHYNNIGADINEYLEVQQGVGFFKSNFEKIKFYNSQNSLYKTLLLSQMTSLGRGVFSFKFPLSDSFANIGWFELRDSYDSLVEKVIYSPDSLHIEDYKSFGMFNTRRYFIGENENTPTGTSLSFCGFTFGGGVGNLTLQSIAATIDSVNSCLTLPISLGNFSYTLINKTIRLHWETLSEANTKYFAIERSSDGTNFTTLGNTAAAGNSSDKRTYSFADNNPRYINHYRIRQVDVDGKFSYTKMLFVKVPQANPLEVQGNIIKDNLKVVIHRGEANIGSLILYDFSGKKIQQFKATAGSQTLNFSSIASGSYLLQLLTKDGQVYNQRMVN